MKPPSRIDQALRVLSGHGDLEEQQSIALLDDAGIPATRKKVDAWCKCYGLAAVKGSGKPFRAGPFSGDLIVHGELLVFKGHVELDVDRLQGLPDRAVALFDRTRGIDDPVNQHPVVEVNPLANISPIRPVVIERLQ